MQQREHTTEREKVRTVRQGSFRPDGEVKQEKPGVKQRDVPIALASPGFSVLAGQACWMCIYF